MEQRIAQIAEQQGVDIPTVRARILQKTAADQGLQLPPEAIQQFAVGMISLQDALSQGTPVRQAGSMGAMAMQQPNAQLQMQAGGMVGAELFEEGDSDINNALNTMAAVSNPEVPDMPASNGMALPGGEMGGGDMMMDQGLEEMEVLELKAKYQEVAIATVEAANKAIQEGAPPEQLKEPVKERLLAIDEQYRQKTGTNDTILTPEFMTKLQGLTDVIPAMQMGGLKGYEPGGVVTDDYTNTASENQEYEYRRAKKARVALETKLAERTNSRERKEINRVLTIARETEAKALAKLGGTPPEDYTDTQLDDLQYNYNILRNKRITLEAEKEKETNPREGSNIRFKLDDTRKKEAEALALLEAPPGGDSSEKILEQIKAPSTVSSSSSELQKKKQELARRAAYLGGKTKQSGLSGLFDVMGQADAAEVAALSNMPQQLSANESALERMKMEIEAKRSLPGTMTEKERDLASGSKIYAQGLFDRLLQKEGDIEAVIEDFIENGVPVPEVIGVVQGSYKEGEKIITFPSFYQTAKTGNPQLTIEQIITAWQKALSENSK